MSIIEDMVKSGEVCRMCNVPIKGKPTGHRRTCKKCVRRIAYEKEKEYKKGKQGGGK